ncbi:MAG TPA: transcription elongation factor GreA, partial [Thermomicrobiales bacterium]|nr:transcription elongation factor GreA [Thermomicrobiales bacterium]
MDAKQTPVTRDGLERLKDELRELKEVRRPQIVAAIAEARSHGDLRENAGYDAAKHDQAMVEKKIA